MPEPHIILLMADHLRYDCLSCYGDLEVRTPHLDALAEESITFDHAYCSTPLCVPTRTSIATGKWPHTTGCFVNGGSYECEQAFAQAGSAHRSYYEQFAAHGYGVTHVGVDHVRTVPPLAERVPGMDLVGRRDHADHLSQHGIEAPINEAARKPSPEFENGRVTAKMYHSPMHVEPTPFGREHFLDWYWADRMIEKIRTADPSDPHVWSFLCWAPHPPFFVPEPYASLYDPAAIKLPGNVGRWHEGQPGFLLHGSGARGSQFTAEDWRPTWAAYFGLCTLADDCIGRVIQAFKDQGIWDDALVVFTQDHGDCLGAHGLFQKFVMYEESAHVPLLLKPPGATSSGRRTQPVGHVDLADTFCDYAGLDPMPGTWGSSLRPLVEEPGAPWRDATFCEFNGDHGRGYPTRAVMTGRYKYFHHFSGKDELYDIVEDPLEERSLIDAPEHADRCREMRDMIRRWMQETGDMLDMDRDADFHPARWRDYDPVRGWGSGAPTGPAGTEATE